ncbi:MAG: DUF4258 domain-containing protein [Deltaproteobacteria bacterium]|jgi:hypothetical protein|nr:DUF4258 domain-containing protein [Deltaproteobacteria bacterium]
MKITFSRHAKRQMKWRKITEKEVKSVIADPDILVDTIKGRKNAYGIVGKRQIKITYKLESEAATIITAVVKGE